MSKRYQVTVRCKATSRAGRRILAGAKAVPYRAGFARVLSFEEDGDELVLELEYRSGPGPTGPGLNHALAPACFRGAGQRAMARTLGVG